MKIDITKEELEEVKTEWADIEKIVAERLHLRECASVTTATPCSVFRYKPPWLNALGRKALSGKLK